MRDTIHISSDEVQSKVDSILEDVQEELAQKSDMLNEAIKRNIEYKSQIDGIEAKNTLSEKVSGSLQNLKERNLRKYLKNLLQKRLTKRLSQNLKKFNQKILKVKKLKLLRL